LCHAANLQNLNPYGKAICDQSGTTQARIQAVEDVDSDADPTGSSNITEINASTQPGWTTAAVPTYARGDCQATGNSETAPAGVSGLLDPAAPECTVDADCDDNIFCNGTETCVAGSCVTGTPPSCDDGVSCTEDTCDVTSDACMNTPDDASCDDGDVCNGAETCNATLDCQAGTPLDCDDLELCTTDSCDSVTGCANVPVECPAGEQCDPADGQCKAPPECTVNEDCDDNIFCNGAETCDAGTCVNGTPPSCDDGVGCTVDTCDVTSDACMNTPDDASCDDGDVCTGTETCDATLDCQAGTPLDCDDLELCTTDSCDSLTGCANVPVECPAGEQCDSADGICKAPPECTVDLDCDDGFFCNGAETCDAGTCVNGTPPSCDDGVGCTADTCDETSDACMNTPDDALCDDGNVCTGAGTCDATLDCQAGTPLDCDDGELCTNDSCDPLTGCANIPVECPAGEQCDPADGICKAGPECTVDADCDDAMFCNGVETCDTATGNCQAGTPVDCDDGVGCTVDTCDETNDACANTPDDASCDDGDVCTGAETCDATLDCQGGTPLDCDDLELCTTDSCDAVAGCVFTPVECPAGEQCDPADGICKGEPECTVDSDCDDAMFCNGAETCETSTGTCQSGTPPDCDDGVDCTVDTCDETSDACMNTPDDIACPDDGLFCTGDEICDPSAGCVSTGDPCPEWITTCNEDTDTCDMVTGKVTICHIPPGNNGNARTLSINSKAIGAHLSHGDIIGPCP
jgi:hypothetical protein